MAKKGNNTEVEPIETATPKTLSTSNTGNKTEEIKETKTDDKLYIYIGPGIDKRGYVIFKNAFINQSTYDKMNKIEDFKEDMKDFKDFDEYVAKGGK
ncbi:MAG: hypothetical protein CR959_01360 [Fusobacteriales bacterium]|nr:MAG: hypothetical protein CR959_01360 [Fusobacteriales bacterium]